MIISQLHHFMTVTNLIVIGSIKYKLPWQLYGKISVNGTGGREVIFQIYLDITDFLSMYLIDVVIKSALWSWLYYKLP